VLPDIGRPVMAKAIVRIPDIDWMHAVASAISQAVAVAGWSHKEAAAKVGVDDAEFGKWLQGNRRPHLDRLLAVSELRLPIVVALAALDPDSFTVKTIIEARRTA
jgi:transcriptional regulator with XRE-family HTH domain